MRGGIQVLLRVTPTICTVGFVIYIKTLIWGIRQIRLILQNILYDNLIPILSECVYILIFLFQPFQVAEVFTGHPGKLVPIEETIRVSLSLHPCVCVFIIWNVFCDIIILFFRGSRKSSEVKWIICLKWPSTWSVPLKKSYKRQKNWRSKNCRVPTVLII